MSKQEKERHAANLRRITDAMDRAWAASYAVQMCRWRNPEDGCCADPRRMEPTCEPHVCTMYRREGDVRVSKMEAKIERLQAENTWTHVNDALPAPTPSGRLKDVLISGEDKWDRGWYALGKWWHYGPLGQPVEAPWVRYWRYVTPPRETMCDG